MKNPAIGPATKLCMSLAARPGTFGSRFHNYLYEKLGLDFLYKAFTTDNLPAAIGGIRALGIRGCAISMPFKEDVIPLLDEVGPSAAAIDSVNTIVNEEGRLYGYNTDYSAVRALVDALPDERASPFVLLGSGGMAKAVATALVDAGFSAGTIAARNEVRGRALAEKLGCGWVGSVEGINASILINVTPLGMIGPDADAIPFSEEQIAASTTVVDAVARPFDTPLLKSAWAAGKATITGAEIAVRQSLEQFILYTGVRPSPEDIGAAETYALASE